MFAIHTVFILKENILFLEEWIQYHILIGFDKFYLYDNSKCQVPGYFDLENCKKLKLGKINKYGINYDEIVKLTNEQINQTLSGILQKYKDNIILVEWSPLNNNGYITYGQELAHEHCLTKLKEDKIHWCANIDMDEFIVIQNIKEYVNKLDKEVSNINLNQIQFENRFRNIGKLITDIQKSSEIDTSFGHAKKNIYRVDDTKAMGVHTWRGNGVEIQPPLNEIWFNHYKLNSIDSNKIKILDNISSKIKETIAQESENFILEQYSKQSSSEYHPK